MAQFAVTVVERPAVKTAGLKVRTSMAKASQDCPRIWEQEFGPRMESFPADPQQAGQSYGVSIMLDSETFDYWAVMPIAPGADVPEGMDILEIPGGLYVECHLDSLAQLGDAYTYIYTAWGSTNGKYALNMQGASLELYTCEYLNSGKLTIYCPVVEK